MNGLDKVKTHTQLPEEILVLSTADGICVLHCALEAEEPFVRSCSAQYKMAVALAMLVLTLQTAADKALQHRQNVCSLCDLSAGGNSVTAVGKS
jgi:uncharacterized membrane protein YgdD (TMEM256/DUF423 family)